MRRREICSWFLVALATPLAPFIVSEAGGGSPPRVVAVRHFASPAHARIVVELSEPAEPAIKALTAREHGPPERLYLDLPGVNVGHEITKSLDVPVGPLAAVRVGKRDADTTRLVIVLREVEAYELSRLGGPPRVVLDLRASVHAPQNTLDGRHDVSKGEAVELSKPTSTPQQEEKSEQTPPPPQAPATVTPHREAPDGRAEVVAAGVDPDRQTGKNRRESAPFKIAPLKIVIDPGHGGRDPGARGIGGLLEKTVVLEIARRLASSLRSELGASVVLTRDRDVFVSLETRTAIANAERADLFISIHANASSSRRLAGVETYYLENTNDRATLRLAAMENGLTLIGPVPATGGQELSYILSDLVQQGKIEDSIALSKALHRGLVRRLTKAHPDVVDLGVKRGPFYVLVGAYMPCALAEVSFLTSTVEGKRLGTQSYRDAIAEGLVSGVRNYVAGLRRARTL